MKKRTITALLLVVALSVSSALGVTAGEVTEYSVDDNRIEFRLPVWYEIPIVPPENDDKTPGTCPDTPPVGTGPFTLTWVPTFDFGTWDIGLNMDTVFNVLPATAPVDSHFVGVQDKRVWAGDAFTGWTVTMYMYSEFATATDELTGAEILFSRVHASGIDMEGEELEHGDAGLPGTLMTANSVLSYDGAAVTVATASATEGHGRTALSFGHGADVRLDIQSRANASVGDFTATIDWVLTAGVVTP
jgi:hypothetical protein